MNISLTHHIQQLQLFKIHFNIFFLTLECMPIYKEQCFRIVLAKYYCYSKIWQMKLRIILSTIYTCTHLATPPQYDIHHLLSKYSVPCNRQSITVIQLSYHVLSKRQRLLFYSNGNSFMMNTSFVLKHSL